MPEEKQEILSTEQVNVILAKAWALSPSTNKSKKIENLTATDWDTFSSDLEILFTTLENSKELPKPTGETFSDLFGKNMTKQIQSIYALILYILIKENKISDADKLLFPNFKKHKSHFLQKYLNERKSETIENLNEQIVKIELPVSEPIPKVDSSSSYKNYLLLCLLLIGIVLVLFFWRWNRKQELGTVETDDSRIKLNFVNFTNEKYAPCDVEFEYDISELNYSEAYIDFGTPEQPIIVPLEFSKGRIWQTFTHSQGRDIKVVVDKSVKKFLLTLSSKNWLVMLDKLYEIPLQNGGVLHYPVNKVPTSIIKDGEFYINYQYINDFDFDADNLIFETRLKNPQIEGGISCFDMGIDLNGEINQKRGILSFNLLSKGCERFAKIRVGETTLPLNQSQKLTKSGVDTTNWIVVRTETTNQILKIFVNDEVRYIVPYKGKIGKLKFMQIGFKGSGSVDWVKVKSADKKVLYFEDFN